MTYTNVVGNTRTDEITIDSHINSATELHWQTKSRDKDARLNLPSKVSKTVTDYIIYTYDATGRKLSQQVFGTGAKTTDYIGEMVYENDALQFITHSEGRVIADNTPGATDPWEYQYFLKDHLGNTRVVFSEKRSVAEYIATMETDRAVEEQQVFKKYNALGAMNLFDHTDDGPDYTRSHLLNGSSNYQVGLAKSFVVNPGDIVDLEVYAKYEAIASPPQNTLTDLLSAVISAFSLGAGTTPLDGSQAQTAFNTQFPAGGPWITDDDWDTNAPKAYLNYLLFNENFELVNFGFDQISTAAKQTGVSPDVEHEYLSLHVQVQEKGYLYIYLSNENLDRVNVYFDDMKIVHHTAVEQLGDYYPFGLAFNSYQHENSVDQKHLYNGKEYQDELNVGWLDYGARMYDPAVGRWGVPDLLAELAFNLTPFRYCFNNPTNYSDPFGLWEKDANGNYSTNNKEDIERFVSYLTVENSVLNNNPSMSAINGFIEEESGGLLGKLSDGSQLVSSVSVTGYDHGNHINWYTDKESFDNAWHDVQGSLTPDALDPRTLGHNIFWLNYPGPNNPKTYSGMDDYSHPPTLVEMPGYIHDKEYDALGIRGSDGLFKNEKALGADFRFVSSQLIISMNPLVSSLESVESGILAVGLGAAATPKAINYYLLPRGPGVDYNINATRPFE